MVKCPNCGADFAEGHQFCSACGKIQNISSGPSYGPVLAFACVGLLVILLWALGKNIQMTATAVPQPTPTPDEVAALLQRCGTADRDFVAPANANTPERRWLLYTSAKVRAGFERDAERPPAWKSVGYFDPLAKKRLGPKQLLKQLPCARNDAH